MSDAQSQLLPLPATSPETGFDRQAGANAGKLPAGPGRPAGSKNKLNRDLVLLVSQRLGRHPLEEMAHWYKASKDELMTQFHLSSEAQVGKMRHRLLEKLVEATTPKQPVAVINSTNSNVNLILGDLAQDAPEMTGLDDDAVLDLPSNDFNGLAA